MSECNDAVIVIGCASCLCLQLIIHSKAAHASTRSLWRLFVQPLSFSHVLLLSLPLSVSASLSLSVSLCLSLSLFLSLSRKTRTPISHLSPVCSGAKRQESQLSWRLQDRSRCFEGLSGSGPAQTHCRRRLLLDTDWSLQPFAYQSLQRSCDSFCITEQVHGARSNQS